MAKKAAAKPAARKVTRHRPNPAAVPRPGATSQARAEASAAEVGRARSGAASNREVHSNARNVAGKIRVRALDIGFYANERRRAGDVFTIASEKDFSEKWMERVDGKTPLRSTTPNQAIAAQHDEILAMKDRANVGGAQPHTDDAPADLKDSGNNPLDAD